MKKNDTAQEVADLRGLLFSTKCRAEIATILLDLNHKDLLPTILEDLYTGAQYILDNHCVKEG